MDWFLNNSAYVYFVAMAVPLALSAVLHTFCAWNMNTYRKLHVDEDLRTLSRDMHSLMAAMCLTMLLLHGLILEYMVTFCATQPFLGALAHIPLIVVLWLKGFNSAAHLKRQRAMIAARLV